MADYKFEKTNTKLKLIYEFDPGYGFKLSDLEIERGIPIKRTFYINKDTEYNIVEDNIIEFVIGELEGEYYKLDKNVFKTTNIFYFHKDIDLKVKYFLQNNRVSVLKKIDEIIEEDLYIGGGEINSMPKETYIDMINNFPNSTELKKYQQMRIEYLCENYIFSKKDFKQNYNDYVSKKDSKFTNEGLKIDENIISMELSKYEYILDKLDNILKKSEKYSENDWQKAIANILILLNPNYIGFLEKIKIPIEEEGNFREPDFILVDSDGFIDIIEIKKADNIQILNKRQYRNNFIPSQDLSGAIMQCNKYCFWLIQNRKKNEELISKKFKEKYGVDMKINIRSPKFTVILGRNEGLTEKQIKDFKTIKNQYNNVIEILTYDDIITRLNRIIATLKNNQ